MTDISIYKAITITHKTSNLKQISDYVVMTGNNDNLQELLHELKDEFGFGELLYLSTCNRVLYLFTTPKKLSQSFTKRFLSAVNPVFKSKSANKRIDEEVLTYEGMLAVNYVYEVAASVDSLVVGEREILRQLRESYKQCQDWKLTGDHLRLLMRYVVTGAKKVYANTRIGEKPISVVSLAVQKMLASKFPRRSRILLVGAGQTNNLVSKFLAKYEYQNVTVFNRTLEKAEKLALRFSNGRAFGLDELADYKEGFDIIIACTGSVKLLVTNELYSNLLNQDTNHKMVIDLSIPNNVDRIIAEVHDVNYIEIEDIRQMAKVNLAFREREVTNAKAIIKEDLAAFHVQFQHRQVELAMREIPVQIKEVKTKAMTEVFKKELEGLDDSTIDLMNRMLTYMEKKCISIPMKMAKEIAISGQ
ncbi:MAG: glutamyl-tRNA reductase [Saprospiraceae bacterium]|jgi:glutamyl-tRNA reductase